MIIRKSPAEIEKMAAAGEILARCHEILRVKARPGVTTLELDETAERFIRSQGAEPAFKGFRGFPGSICASPNSMVVHGIPGPYELKRGDVLSVDVGVVLDGWVADGAMTHPIGKVTPIATRLLATTKASLFDAVEQCQRGQPPGGRVARGAAPRGGGRLLGDPSLVGPRHRPRHARGPADPELRRSRYRPGAGGGHGAGHRADGERRRRARSGWGRTTGRCTPATALSPPTSSTPWPSQRRVRASSPPGTCRPGKRPRSGAQAASRA